MTQLSYDALVSLCDGKLGNHDVACPLCGPSRRDPANRKRRVLRIWQGTPGLASYHCARCGEHGWARGDNDQVIAVLRSRGMREQTGFRTLPQLAHRRAVDLDDIKRTEAALVIWHSAKSAQGTLLETYLGSRGIHLTLPDALRFHAGLKHPSGGIWPAMVALVTNGADGTPLAIHRTFLARDGGGKAPVDPQKMMLGPCRGGRGAPRRSGRRADGRRRHRDLPRRHAGDRPSRLGGALDLRAAALDLPT